MERVCRSETKIPIKSMPNVVSIENVGVPPVGVHLFLEQIGDRALSGTRGSIYGDDESATRHEQPTSDLPQNLGRT